jgi:bifunctional UDP-N-acetylglucosamine pyrophosphorylase/glucosamine-1-phosphate N-acetyltransferase
MCQEEGHAIASIYAEDPLEVQGVNNRLQLQELERIWQQREAKRLLLEGVYIVDSHRFDVRGELTVGKDVFIDINCLFIGKVVLGDHCYIGPNSVLQNVTLGSHTHIYANSVLENSLIGAHCHIGPFARIRPNTILEDHCKIGNFVETKNSTLASGTKANHLSYLGDATIGQGVNIGAGTITCNYDGANKHSTIIEDEVFVGSGTQLVAPITLGHGATIGAGTTIRKNVPPQTLVLSEKTQKTMVDWKRPQKSSPKK